MFLVLNVKLGNNNFVDVLIFPLLIATFPNDGPIPVALPSHTGRLLAFKLFQVLVCPFTRNTQRGQKHILQFRLYRTFLLNQSASLIIFNE